MTTFATIPGHGGCWHDGAFCGSLCRFSVDAPFAFYDVGASRLTIRSDDIIDHTDSHDISEDIVTISHLGGLRRNGLPCGMFNRHLNNSPYHSDGNVASRSMLITTEHRRPLHFCIIEDLPDLCIGGG